MDDSANYWVRPEARIPVGTPPSAPLPDFGGRISERKGRQIVLLVLLALFLFDTFLPWQRACVDLIAFGFHLAGCLSANAWSDTAAQAGQAAGALAMGTIVVVGLQLGGVGLGEGGRLVARVGLYGTVAAGSLKWLLVIGKLASFGAWFGLLLLLAIAVVESIDWLAIR